MTEENKQTDSVSFVTAREKLLKAILDNSSETLLSMIKEHGKDSQKYVMTDHIFQVIKKEYEFLREKRKLREFCHENGLSPLVILAHVEELQELKV
ncbi:hypothetical protein J2755_000659 [Methanohalophilus levihalophilus]|uniref:hypothetical protein n=1 Tax=Methanohalophilus levihalophilus TaxID=1431282 RepID=UPI001AE48193|nr:hypothetical protein [Methanohalophilus levihalophilus]MBP2029739.1 hypothetical protein [Methanohalophilus levihalophilus]